MAPQAVMAAIAEALVATAVGLAVAIPAVAMYNVFQRRGEGHPREHRGAQSRCCSRTWSPTVRATGERRTDVAGQQQRTTTD